MDVRWVCFYPPSDRGSRKKRKKDSLFKREGETVRKICGRERERDKIGNLTMAPYGWKRDSDKKEERGCGERKRKREREQKS